MTVTVERLEKILEKASKGDPYKELVVAESLETLDKLEDLAYDMYHTARKSRNNDDEASVGLYSAVLDAAIEHAYITSQIAMETIIDNEGTAIELGDKFKIIGDSDIHQVYDREITYNHAVVKYREDKVFVCDASDVIVVEKADGTKVEFPETYGMPKRCKVRCGRCLGESLMATNCPTAIEEFQRIEYRPFECRNSAAAECMDRVVQILDREGIDVNEPMPRMDSMQRMAFMLLHCDIKFVESVYADSETLPESVREGLEEKLKRFEDRF